MGEVVGVIRQFALAAFDLAGEIFPGVGGHGRGAFAEFLVEGFDGGLLFLEGGAFGFDTGLHRGDGLAAFLRGGERGLHIDDGDFGGDRQRRSDGLGVDGDGEYSQSDGHRAHFFAVSAQIMRRILVDAARTRQSVKRGGQARREDHSEAFSLNELPDLSVSRDRELVAIDEALSALAASDARKARVVELKFFAGLSVEEIAEVLKISVPTAVRDWKFARAWLMRELRAGGAGL